MTEAPQLQKKSFTVSMKALSPFLLQLLADGLDVKLTVTGSSMFPLLRNNTDSVILTKPNGLKKYDVVLYQRKNGDFILHRIIDASKDTFTMAGDFEVCKEYPVKASQVVALMKAFHRGPHIVSCRSPFYIAYSRIWVRLFPWRLLLLKLLRRFARFFPGLRRGEERC